ncbi:DUF3892 domain-containing protein [Microvirga sp. HBU67558]|uniref:DUF3892 domain-containing protein n=1 Tax=Microvirga TaxID=186650 RepID=UPI001B366D91|nr:MULTISPECIES: DUF3892 domain-containing protein [unclassified Microvirga]MBQ0819252.1 DUF3892 domain-containing protein [Microvirga sp. HBU67558]
MAGRFQIRCINKDDRRNVYECITHVGGVGTTHWRLAVEDVIQRIESGAESFDVSRPQGDTVDVIVATRSERKYLKTKADGGEPNNLLSLPECSV